jgi:hypothetical protein
MNWAIRAGQVGSSELLDGPIRLLFTNSSALTDIANLINLSVSLSLTLE